MPETMKETIVAPVVEPQPKPEEDLMSRVSKVKLDAVKPVIDEEKFDPKDIEKIPDPVAKKYAEQAYKSFEKGYQKKFQDLAEQRKEVEQKLNEFSNWTPEKIHTLLNDPKFVESAQAVAKSQAPQNWNGSQEQWSSLNDNEKQEWAQMKNAVNQMSMALTLEHQRRQDDGLKQKYANYEPQAVDTITAELLAGKARATREDIWKVYDYENAVKRAYELGKMDKRPEMEEKANASSYDGLSVNQPKTTEKPQTGEGNLTAFKRIVLENLAKAKGRNI